VGRYRDLVNGTLEILQELAPSPAAWLLSDACFDPNLLDELALDPRGFDFGHPANRRPNYAFGEWDPHHLDNQGRFRRFVVRQVVLDALLDRIVNPGELPVDEVLYEASAVLAGVILMAAGTSGSGPDTHDSMTTLTTLVPRIAKYRDAFYAHLLESAPSPRRERLQAEAKKTRQAFGGARQHLNHYLARQRATQMQQRQLALLFAAMGFPMPAGKPRQPSPSFRCDSSARCWAD